MKAYGAKDPIAIATDVQFEENCKKVVDEVVNEYGSIDILVNIAGEQHYATSIEDITETDLERVFRTNIFSQFFLSEYARSQSQVHFSHNSIDAKA